LTPKSTKGDLDAGTVPDTLGRSTKARREAVTSVAAEIGHLGRQRSWTGRSPRNCPGCFCCFLQRIRTHKHTRFGRNPRSLAGAEVACWRHGKRYLV